MTETPVPRLKVIQVTEMMSKCRKCHLRETKFTKFPGGGIPPDPLEACALGTCASAFSTKKYSLFSFERGWNLRNSNVNKFLTVMMSQSAVLLTSFCGRPFIQLDCLQSVSLSKFV